MTEFFNPKPKKKVVRLSAVEYQRQKEKAYAQQKGLCKVCGFWMAPEEASWHHTETGGVGMKGDDHKGYLTHVLCHPPKVKKKY